MWINKETLGEFTLHADIRYELWKQGKEAPGVLTDEYLAANGYPVLVPIRPEYDPITHYLAPRTGTLVNGVWEKHYDVIPLDPAIVANNLSIIEAQARAKWQIISPRQIRQALTAAGLRSAVESAVAAGDQDLKDWWEFATQFEREHPMVVSMAAGLGVSTAQLDALFQAAAAL